MVVIFGLALAFPAFISAADPLSIRCEPSAEEDFLILYLLQNSISRRRVSCFSFSFSSRGSRRVLERRGGLGRPPLRPESEAVDLES